MFFVYKGIKKSIIGTWKIPKYMETNTLLNTLLIKPSVGKDEEPS